MLERVGSLVGLVLVAACAAPPPDCRDPGAADVVLGQSSCPACPTCAMAVASPVSSYEEPPFLSASSPRHGASAYASSSVFVPTKGCNGFLEIKLTSGTFRLTGGCRSWRALGGPAGNITDPLGDTKLNVSACDEHMQVELKGATKKLPGTIRVARLERSVPHEYRSLRKSEKAEITVTKFDDVYGMIEGTFKATMVPALNEGPETVSGSFRVCRGADD